MPGAQKDLSPKNLSGNAAIEAEMDQTRERLAANIDLLAYRLSPATIAKREVDQIKGFFVTPKGEVRTDNVLKVVGGVVGVVVVLATIRRIVR